MKGRKEEGKDSSDPHVSAALTLIKKVRFLSLVFMPFVRQRYYIKLQIHYLVMAFSIRNALFIISSVCQCMNNVPYVPIFILELFQDLD